MIKVVNEYENLKIGLVHTPGSEINQLTPDNLSRLLFEDMPYLPKAIEEHNQFKKKMKENGFFGEYLNEKPETLRFLI